MQTLHATLRNCGCVLVTGLLVTATVLGNERGHNVRRSGNYLVIAASDYVGSAPLNEFVAAKSGQGFNVMTYSVPSGTSRTAIKSYIESLWGTGEAPDYILLVGDTDGSNSTANTIPYWNGGGSKAAPTDLPYACMDAGDDWYPDIAIGRFSVRDVSTLANVVEKSLFVEAGNFPDPNYALRGAFLANPSTQGMAEPTHDWVIENYFEPNGYEGIRIYSSQGGNTQDVTDAVNRGCLWLVYYGHSGSSGWWDPAFSQSNVQALSNAGLYGVVFSFSCNVGAYTYAECFGETWLRVADRGAAAVIFPSSYIYWGSVEAWMPSTVLEHSFYRAFFEDDIWEVGPAWQAGLYHFLEDYDGDEDIKRNFFELYNIMGDPSLLLPGGESFEVRADPAGQNLCSPPDDEAVYTVDVLGEGNFEEPVTLSTMGAPAGAVVEFSVNSQVPPFTSIMTIRNVTPGSPGVYSIKITGDAESMEASCFVSLYLSDSGPGAVTLMSPADGADDMPLSPTLTWSPVAQGVEYDVEVASDPDFANVVYSASVLETTHTLGIELERAATYYWHVRAGNACGLADFSAPFSFTTYVDADYFTEEFTGDFDLAYFTLSFVPDGTGDFYRTCGEPASELPTAPVGGLTIHLADDGFGHIELISGRTIPLYGTEYNSYFVGSNGYITFTGGDNDNSESLSDHFDLPRISALFDDLAPEGGTVRIHQLADRAVVTFEDVPQQGTSDSNTFQIEMFFNGLIRITWLNIDATDAVVGLSQGAGVPADFAESDLSAVEPCITDTPPTAEDASVSTIANIPIAIDLVATDDGLPDPPGALDYIIVWRPSHGRLDDPGAGPIDAVPYTLAGGGNQVVYTPDHWYLGPDSFAFKANDGGEPPTGGDSNIATVSIEVDSPAPEAVYTYPLDSDPGWLTEGLWAFGPPTGSGSHYGDPYSGNTGANVYGYNLDGDYSNSMPEYYLTSTAIDCSELFDVELRFWKWLGVERAPYDHAAVQISNDGSAWTTLWANPATTISDSAWSQMTFDISAVADGEPTVYLRWTMGTSDGSTTYPGWNIDDIEIWGVFMGSDCFGDLDGDRDIDLSDLSRLLANYGTTGGADYEDGDLDGDGDVDLADLSALLSAYGTTCP
jgi:hypothetical protein